MARSQPSPRISRANIKGTLFSPPSDVRFSEGQNDLAFIFLANSASQWGIGAVQTNTELSQNLATNMLCIS